MPLRPRPGIGLALPQRRPPGLRTAVSLHQPPVARPPDHRLSRKPGNVGRGGSSRRSHPESGQIARRTARTPLASDTTTAPYRFGTRLAQSDRRHRQPLRDVRTLSRLRPQLQGE